MELRMKNIFGVMVLMSASIVAAGDADLKSAAHTVAVAEAMAMAVQKPSLIHPVYSVGGTPEMQRALYEARKDCKPCLLIEHMKRCITNNEVNAHLLELVEDIVIEMNEFYEKKCPADVYQKIPNEDLAAYKSNHKSKI